MKKLDRRAFHLSFMTAVALGYSISGKATFAQTPNSQSTNIYSNVKIRMRYFRRNRKVSIWLHVSDPQNMADNIPLTFALLTGKTQQRILYSKDLVSTKDLCHSVRIGYLFAKDDPQVKQPLYCAVYVASSPPISRSWELASHPII